MTKTSNQTSGQYTYHQSKYVLLLAKHKHKQPALFDVYRQGLNDTVTTRTVTLDEIMNNYGYLFTENDILWFRFFGKFNDKRHAFQFELNHFLEMNDGLE